MTRHLPQDTTISSSNNQNLEDKYEFLYENIVQSMKAIITNV